MFRGCGVFSGGGICDYWGSGLFMGREEGGDSDRRKVGEVEEGKGSIDNFRRVLRGRDGIMSIESIFFNFVFGVGFFLC